MTRKPNENNEQQIERARHLDILNILKVEPSVNVKQLAERLETSQSTIRRDLEVMQTLGLVRRVFGGAILEKTNSNEPPFEMRQTLHPEQKMLLSRLAADWVNDGDIVFIDGGTTTQFIVPYLASKRNLTVITCGLNVAYELNRLQNITAYIIGGQIHHDSHSISGPLALVNLEMHKIRCNKAFIAASAVSAEHGVTNLILDRIPMKRKAMEISQQSIVVADGSKIGEVALGQIAPITAFAGLVTDSSANPVEIEAIRTLNVDVKIAYPAKS